MNNVLEEVKQKATTLNDDMKNIFEEIQRGVYKRPRDVFDRMFNLADQFSEDMFAILGDLQKTVKEEAKSGYEVWQETVDMTKNELPKYHSAGELSEKIKEIRKDPVSRLAKNKPEIIDKIGFRNASNATAIAVKPSVPVLPMKNKSKYPQDPLTAMIPANPNKAPDKAIAIHTLRLVCNPQTLAASGFAPVILI